MRTKSIQTSLRIVFASMLLVGTVGCTAAEPEIAEESGSLPAPLEEPGINTFWHPEAVTAGRLYTAVRLIRTEAFATTTADEYWQTANIGTAWRTAVAGAGLTGLSIAPVPEIVTDVPAFKGSPEEIQQSLRDDQAEAGWGGAFILRLDRYDPGWRQSQQARQFRPEVGVTVWLVREDLAPLWVAQGHIRAGEDPAPGSGREVEQFRMLLRALFEHLAADLRDFWTTPEVRDRRATLTERETETWFGTDDAEAVPDDTPSPAPAADPAAPPAADNTPAVEPE